MPTKCIFIEPIAKIQTDLRRYVSSIEKDKKCPLLGCHNAKVVIGIEDCPVDEDRIHGDTHPHNDERWPKACKCGYVFEEDDKWQCNPERMYGCKEAGLETTLHDAPPGAMWYADWMGRFFRGPDGKCLVVKLPNGGDWVIDGRATNCTKPDDKEHNCWYRTGTPPNITIVHPHKNSCSAGAGSIGMTAGGKYYHGFLRKGHLTDHLG